MTLINQGHPRGEGAVTRRLVRARASVYFKFVRENPSDFQIMRRDLELPISNCHIRKMKIRQRRGKCDLVGHIKNNVAIFGFWSKIFWRDGIISCPKYYVTRLNPFNHY